jgi:hypothetical protein
VYQAKSLSRKVTLLSRQLLYPYLVFVNTIHRSYFYSSIGVLSWLHTFLRSLRSYVGSAYCHDYNFFKYFLVISMLTILSLSLPLTYLSYLSLQIPQLSHAYRRRQNTKQLIQAFYPGGGGTNKPIAGRIHTTWHFYN